MKKYQGLLRSIVFVCIVSILYLASAVASQAEVTLSGSQTRGQGTDGKLRCSGVKLPDGGVIAAASDTGGAGLWLQGPGGAVLRFTPASKAAGAKLDSGTWYAYPNLPPKANSADCTVTITTEKSGGTKSFDGTYSGTWGEMGQLKLTVKNGAVTGVLTGSDSSGTVISVNLNGTVNASGTIQATTRGSIKASGTTIAAGGAFSGKLANGAGSGTYNFTIQTGDNEVQAMQWKAQK